ncbi:uncharacterized protein [Parasteatoda tepidariorum]|uniref:uncharacterized protein n=1 Tax=Parasteatoda tepidariorum TaxID=114398 RepID=UPI001C72264A|nr:uncharacterized protein LOC122269370 [Parasteatoda tepidariorum]
MNSAAVIGRQLRQQNTGRGAPPPGKGRQRAFSHQPLTNAQLAQLQKQKEEEKKKVSTIQSIRNKVTVQCLWLTCKALSGGMILLIIGTTMSVVGFYADTLSTEIRESGNSTIEVTDRDRQYHLHNLTYVGPVIMGLGGFFIVAAFVLTFETHDDRSKVVPVTDDHASTDNSLLTSLLIDDKKDKQNGPSSSGPYLCVPQAFDVPPQPLRKQSVTLANGKPGKITPIKEDVRTIIKSKASESTGARKKDHTTIEIAAATCSSKGAKPPPAYLPIMKREYSTGPNGRMRNRELMMMQLCLDEFVPSPQDIEIIDPDGCDTPRRDNGPTSSMDMEVYVSNCPITVRVQIEPRHLASMESDGLSDSDISDPGEIARISRCDVDFPEQQMPLLGRCSPAFSSPEFRRGGSAAPLLKRDSSRRFPLLRQGALDSGRGLDVQTETSLA